MGNEGGAQKKQEQGGHRTELAELTSKAAPLAGKEQKTKGAAEGKKGGGGSHGATFGNTKKKKKKKKKNTGHKCRGHVGKGGGQS